MLGFNQWEEAKECRSETQLKTETQAESDDQFASVILRLQHGLEQSRTKLNSLESHIEQLNKRLKKLEKSRKMSTLERSLCLLLLVILVSRSRFFSRARCK